MAFPGTLGLSPVQRNIYENMFRMLKPHMVCPALNLLVMRIIANIVLGQVFPCSLSIITTRS